jgi:hypothetical protein
MASTHISEAEAALDFAGLMARGRAGEEIVIASPVILRYGTDPRFTLNVRHFRLIPDLTVLTP